MRLLLVEDNGRLAGLIREGLDRQGFAVDWCETADGAEAARRASDYDLVLLDLGLPDAECGCAGEVIAIRGRPGAWLEVDDGVVRARGL